MELHFVILLIGGRLLAGLVADEIGHLMHGPRVTLLILFGVTVGPVGFDLLPNGSTRWYEAVAMTALTMVAFLLGGQLSAATLRRHGREILILSLSIVLITVLVVGAGLIVGGVEIALVRLLAGIATATAPAAVQDVVRQAGADGPFAKTLLGIVAVDDAWGLIVFSLPMVAAKVVLGNGSFDTLGSIGPVGGRRRTFAGRGGRSRHGVFDRAFARRRTHSVRSHWRRLCLCRIWPCGWRFPSCLRDGGRLDRGELGQTPHASLP